MCGQRTVRGDESAVQTQTRPVIKVDWPTPFTSYVLHILWAVTSQSWGRGRNG